MKSPCLGHVVLLILVLFQWSCSERDSDEDKQQDDSGSGDESRVDQASELLGSWTAICLDEDTTDLAPPDDFKSTRTQFAFDEPTDNAGDFRLTNTHFAEPGCSGEIDTANSDVTTGRYRTGDTVTSEDGVTVRELDVDFFINETFDGISINLTGLPDASIETIYQRDGDVLYLGEEPADQEEPGSRRHTKINYEVPFHKDG